MGTMDRRKFIKLTTKFTAASALTAAGGGAYAGLIEPNCLLKTHYDLASRKWPVDCPPLKVAIAADLHTGCPSVGLGRLEEIVDTLNRQDADIILLLGDYLISSVKMGHYIEPSLVGPVLKDLKAPLGVHAVLGNHDWNRDGHGMWKALEQAGINVLENSALRVKRRSGPRADFWIAGLADQLTRTPDIAKTMAGIDGDRPVILMTHDPTTFLHKSQRPAVTLAGHTHGGQVNVPLLGIQGSAGDVPRKYYYGHVVEEGCDLVVSSGIGTSRYPVRFNVPPEIVTMTLGPSLA